MLAKTSNIQHPNGFNLTTPLLVKSFSSKGIRYKKDGDPKQVISEVYPILQRTSEALTDTVLLSAFDLKYYLPSAQELAQSLSPEFIFIDSGGYETSESYDFSDIYQHPVHGGDWSEAAHREVLATIPPGFSTVIVSYDNSNEPKLTLQKQAQRAKALFADFPKSLSNFLIKPSDVGASHINVDQIVADLQYLEGFDILGLTEKELGAKLMERMKNIRTLRLALDNAGNNAPLHIFGSLDPVITVLYFLAGAEIFDGLTWLRFAYYDGLSIYKHNYNVLVERLKEEDDINDARIWFDNIDYLNNLQTQMKKFIVIFKEQGLEEACKCFGTQGEMIKRAYKEFESLI